VDHRLGLAQTGDCAHRLNILLTKTNAHEQNAMIAMAEWRGLNDGCVVESGHT